jgi:hypothetical protein
LPGTRYYHQFGGGVAFSPDGASAVVSPGSDTFLLDVATGAIRATRTPTWSAVLDVAYGWGGRRIVVSEPSLAAHCVHTPNGGTVTVLDAATLAPIATIADLGQYGDARGGGGIPAFRASPTDDLVFATPGVGDPPGTTLNAFRLSDGGALPAPAVASMPLAFMPDGASVVVGSSRGLQRVSLTDGEPVATTPGLPGGPIAVSADGETVAIGGSGGNLLQVWQADGPNNFPMPVCGAAAPIILGDGQQPASLSADGQSIALATDTGVKVYRRDGVYLAGLRATGSPTLSPSGDLVVVKDSSAGDPSPAVVLRTVDGSEMGEVPFDDWNWATFVFSAREDRVYSAGMRDNVYRLDVAHLALLGSGTSIWKIPTFSVVIGTSNGCPVLYQGARGAWRSCGGCDDPAVGSGAMGFNGTDAGSAVLSADGQYVAIRPTIDASNVALWRLPPAAGGVAMLAGRAPSGSWAAHEFPIAVAPGGGRVLTGAESNASCFDGPGFEILVHDVGTGAVVDALPPGPVAVDAAVRTLAYGAQLWCARD